MNSTQTTFPFSPDFLAASWLPDCEHSHPTVHNRMPGDWQLTTGKENGWFGPPRYWLTCTYPVNGPFQRCGAEGEFIEARHIEEAIWTVLSIDIGQHILVEVDPEDFE